MQDCDLKNLRESNMVTSTSPPFSTSDKMFVNNNQMAIDQPFICVDGYMLSCQYDGESCTPVFGIDIDQLLASVKSDLENFNKMTPSICKTPSKSDKIGLIKTSPRSRRPSKPLFQRQNSKDTTVRRNLFTDAEHFSGVSCQTLDQPIRNSFILPLKGRRTTSIDDENVSDISEKNISKSRKAELSTQVKWVEEHGSDYINTETVSNCSELLMLLNILMKSTHAALVTVKVNTTTEIAVTYQFMKKFKQDYMIVRINKGCCMLMKAF
ncbi:uncharacterized protein LOC130640928 isoform X3 [Hydractinia symbiolongicarpus]|uniref:uncharacterized protein LOC130640928 isoform X3 n=1 Tax=Hydractinia symbiolongicarpus TaxID=13093 RepID=UPI00254CF9D0|nr:uncharacterized protein LOC130640928 isoform X3 [Hydractinia symbiolongicarpus]